MEESFELLSTMSPKVKGRQKTIKTRKVSRLALKRHFRRSAIFDKAPPVRNEDLSVVELTHLTSESGESVSSKEFNNREDVIVINSSDSEGETESHLKPEVAFSKKENTSSSSRGRVHQWLDNVEQNEKAITFFSQVSTIYDDGEGPKTDKSADLVAACSSFNDYLTHRFDELFINKDRGAKGQVPTKINDSTGDDLFNLMLGQNASEKQMHSNSQSNEICDMSSLKLSLDEEEENKAESLVVEETFLTASSDRNSKNEPSVKFPVENPDKKDGKIKIGSFKSDISKTPVNKTIKEVESMLDTLYGNSWRKNQHSVLSPLTEPKNRKTSKTNKKPVASSEKPPLPQLKKPLVEMGCLKKKVKKPNLNNLQKPFESPWMKKFEGLVDSGSDSDNEVGSKVLKDLDVVRTKLNFDDQISKSTPSSSNTQFTSKKKGKENIPLKAKSEQIKTKRLTKTDDIDEDISTDDEYDQEIKKLETKRQSILPVKNKSYTFLESLSAIVPLNKCHLTARIFRSNFKQHRDELATRLFTLYNEKVFDNALPNDTKIEWNVKLRKTAGLCYCSKITHRSGRVVRKARITLSTKVLDIPCRLRDTLIHEMCHAAAWIVNQVSDGHGPYWKSWAFKAMEVFPELPPIKRCHSYQIKSKYTYKCTGCGYSFGRHSKSLDIERKRCGHCYSKFEILINKITKQGETKTVSATPRKEPTAFALFVKENYALYKQPERKHGDVMKMLGEKFAQLKVQKGS